MRLLLIISLALSLLGCADSSDQSRQAESTQVSVNQAMGGAVAEGFKRVTGPRPMMFPQDHGPHPDYATEWWYFTGNLETQAGRRFGYQFTLFRIGLAPPGAGPERGSDWRANEIYMGHLAVSDLEAGEHHSRERFARSAAGLAGAQAKPFRVWLNHWQITGSGDPFPLRIEAEQDGLSIKIDLKRPDKESVLQGDKGYSQKGLEVGNASYYYSYTRIPTQGSIKIDDAEFQVSGASWFDREWSSSALESDQAGWDWFSLQLDDGRDLMIYRLRYLDATAHPMSAGVLVDAAGQVTHLMASDFQLEPTREWRSA
ncbi:MAG: lipocalin-like domain-containing protein, partial [Gammaproteobacteria bacterium]